MKSKLETEKKIKQVRLIEAKDLKEIEQQLNGFYCEADIEGYDVISTKLIEKEPPVLQIVYLKGMGEGE